MFVLPASKHRVKATITT